MAHQVAQAERLFAEYHDFIRTTIGHFVRNEDEREDVYQDIFVYFIQKPFPEGIVSPKAYLYRVIWDRIWDRMRRQACYRKHLGGYALSHCPPQELSDTVENNIQAEEVFALLDSHLKKNEANAVKYYYQDDLDIDSTAEKMEVKPRSVSRYLSVGLKKIRKIARKDRD